MKRNIFIGMLCSVVLYSCGNNKLKCNDAACAKKENNELSCKLTTAEMEVRKSTVLESLRKQIIEKKELPNGYAYKFKGNDRMIDELTEFAKTERHCCDFFSFNIAITGDTTSVWFEITGPEKAKGFIKSEMNL